MAVHLSNTHGPATNTTYHRSLPILTKLAKRCQQPNPPDPASSRDDYLDYGMAILGAGTMLVYDMASKDDLDRGFRDSELRMILKMDTRFEESEERIEKRFQGIDERFQGIDERFQSIDERFQEVNQRFDSLELRLSRKIDALEDRIDLKIEAINKQVEVDKERLDHYKGELNNYKAIQRNGKRFKLYHRIEVVRAFKFNPDIGRCQWTASPGFPKHLKAFRNLGNHAKGKWTAEEMANLSPSQRKTKQDRALATLEGLLDFYGVQVFTDDRSESDATDIALSVDSVDDHMEALADEWGLEWYDITRILDEEPNFLAAKKRGSVFWEQHRDVRARIEE